jgi:hypothetical protein
MEINEILENFDRASNPDYEQRRLAVEDGIFVNEEDGQWSEDVSRKRRNRPRYQIDRVSPAIDQVVGDHRQNSVAIKVSPEGAANAATARVYTGLIASIENLSKAQNSYDNAFLETVTGGYGGWRVLTEYSSDDSFDQDVVIKPIPSAASSLYFDPAATEYDRRDAKFGFYVSYMPLTDFEAQYPDRAVTDFTQKEYETSRAKGWFQGESVRIAEYWYKEPYKLEIGLLSDGRVIDMKEDGAAVDELGLEVVKTRRVDSNKVYMVVVNGAEILTKPQEWPGKYIPLIPVFGKNVTIDGRKYVRGMVRKAKDPQRIYNYASSAAIEATALTPKDPIWITPKQAAGFESRLRNFPSQNSPFMFYNPDPAMPGPPQRGGAPQLQQALIQQVAQASQDIHATTGLEPASMGNVPELKSGKAIQSQQEMGDRGAFVYHDNLAKSIEYTGEILVDLIPRIYDSDLWVRWWPRCRRSRGRNLGTGHTYRG